MLKSQEVFKNLGDPYVQPSVEIYVHPAAGKFANARNAPEDVNIDSSVTDFSREEPQKLM